MCNICICIYILADAIVHHMVTVTCIPDKMSNEKERKRKREKEKIKGKEKWKKGGKKRSIIYDMATTMATKEERRKKKQANKRGLKKPGEKWRIKDKKRRSW